MGIFTFLFGDNSDRDDNNNGDGEWITCSRCDGYGILHIVTHVLDEGQLRKVSGSVQCDKCNGAGQIQK